MSVNIESSLPVLVFALTAGMGLGLVYFFILWFTVQRLCSSPAPAALMIFSYMARLALVLTGFYFIMDHRWERVAVALAGFIVMRAILTRLIGRRETMAGTA
ncbi:MAG TPA: ATP synthase subunit I [Deltaproteobacteria bacterium]|nr:ATP synthase subunit I [Deltaproteobacteria bacterium]